jgi:predicted RND superfamily exporter protein
VISCFVLVALINGQLSAQDTDSESIETTTPLVITTKTLSPEEIYAKKTEAFYGKLYETLKTQHSLFIQRVDCIISKLKDEKTYESVDPSNYEFTKNGDEYSITFINKEAIFKELETSINSSAFSCTIVGYCAIILVVFIMIFLVSCVSCLSKKK